MSPAADRLSVEDAAVAARLLRGLPSFLRKPIAPDEARATLRRRLDGRGADFLSLARQAIYAHPASPYRRLLAEAGCSYGDLERLVHLEGVEGALRALLRGGVYLTVDEFKGRRPAVRGSTTTEIDPAGLGNPLAAPHVPVRSSGSRGAGTPGLMDLAFIRACGVDLSLHFAARGPGRAQKATWETPGSGMLRVLQLSAFGAPAARWFCQITPDAPGLSPRYRWGPAVLRLAGLAAGKRLPGPRFVPLEEPLPIARWMAEVLRAGGRPHPVTYPNSAVRLSRAALEAGFDLHGGHVMTVGEPVTERRHASIRQAGLDVFPGYGSIEAGPIGYGCLAPSASDDLHLLRDLHALIQAGPDSPAGNLPPGAVLISSLRSTAPFVMLNVSLGDAAVLEDRGCGCALSELGWSTHLHTIRSFEKLTAGGATFLDTRIIHVLEEVLPARFGGGPTDYQLVESETADGLPCVRLLVHPGVGQLPAEAVADAFLAEIGAGGASERMHGLVWSQPGLLRVERRPPLTTGTGKILHLKVEA